MHHDGGKMKAVLRFLVVVCLLFLSSYAKESCILAFSTKVIYQKDKKLFLKRFPDGIIKKYGKYYEFKIESFQTYKHAKHKLKKVKKLYKDAFIINCQKEVVLKPPVLKQIKIKKIKHKIDSIKTLENIVFVNRVKKIEKTPPVSLKETTLSSKGYHIPLTSFKVSKTDNRPKLNEPKILKPYEIPKLSKRDKTQIYDNLSFKRYIDVLFESNDKTHEIFYQKKIDYILNEIKKDKYDFDVYANGYLRTGSSISAQSGNAPNVNGDYTGAGVSLHVNKILYDGGYRLTNGAYDILYKRLADIDELNAKDRLAILGVSIYSNLYISQEELEILKKILKQQKFVTNIIKQGYKEGKNSPLDLIDSKNDLLNLQRSILNMEYQYLSRDYILRHSTKSRSKKPYQLYPMSVKLNLDSLKLLQKEAIAHSGVLAKESNLLNLKEADLLFQKRRRIPELRFDSYVGYGLSTNKIFNLDSPGNGAFWELGLNFKLPIYNRNDINLNIQKNRLNILKQKEVLSSRQRDILIQVEKSYNEIQRSKKQIDIIKEQLSLQKHKLKIAKERYFAGVSPYRAYSDAIRGFLNYKRQLLSMQQKYKQEISILSILVGKRDFYE